MRGFLSCVLAFCLAAGISGCRGKEKSLSPISSITLKSSEFLYNIMLKRDLLCLMMAYSGYITGVEKDVDGNVYAVMKSGKRILYDDKKDKEFEQKILHADIQDMMEQIYPLEDIPGLVSDGLDPGRFRVYEIMNEVYGASREEIKKNLIAVKGAGKSLQFNSNNNAANCLEDVLVELAHLAQNNREISSFVYPINGTYNFRYIAGTDLLSVHAYAIGIDLAVDKKDYWKWSTKEQGQKRLSEYPQEVVEAFEEHGFIWGGRWSHFDIMHYEYRPELILKARYFYNPPNSGDVWHSNIQIDVPEAEEYIELIDEAVK